MLLQDAEKREAEAERKIEQLTAGLTATRSSLTAAEGGLAQAQGDVERLRQELHAKAGETVIETDPLTERILTKPSSK